MYVRELDLPPHDAFFQVVERLLSFYRPSSIDEAVVTLTGPVSKNLKHQESFTE